MFSKLKAFTPIILLAGDALAVTLFVYLGQLQHQTVNLSNLLVQTLGFVLAWLIAGWLLGVFPKADALDLRSMLLRSVNTWFVAAPLGLLFRAYALDKPAIPALFIVTTYTLGAIFVLGWRVIFALAWKVNAKK